MINTGLFWLLLWTGLIGWLLAAWVRFLQCCGCNAINTHRRKCAGTDCLCWRRCRGWEPLTSLAIAVLPHG